MNGVNGVEVQTGRLWERCDRLGVARVVYVNMLDRERADFSAALEQIRAQLSDRCVAVQIPIGREHELKGVVDLLHMRAYLTPHGRQGGARRPTCQRRWRTRRRRYASSSSRPSSRPTRR